MSRPSSSLYGCRANTTSSIAFVVKNCVISSVALSRWSKSTLPGEPLYRAFGFEETGRVMVRAPDGVELAGVTMQRPVTLI